MNNENRQEQETKEQKTSNFWSDVLKKAQKAEKRKLTYLYIAALLLQIIFLVFQFVPILKVLDGFKIRKLGMITMKLPKNDSALETLGVLSYILGIVCLLISFISTISYFIRKTAKMKSGFFLAKLGVILILLAFFLFSRIWDKYGIFYEIILFSAILYVIIGLALLIILWYLSAIRKTKKQSGEF